MSATIKEIAENLGISKSTVSKALNNASDVNEDTRKTIIDEAVRLGYNLKNLKTQGKNKLCILIENMDYDNIEHFAYEIILGFKSAALNYDFDVDVVPSNMNVKSKYKYDHLMMENKYLGGFMLGLSFHDDFVQQLNNTAYPTVLLDNYIDNEKVAWVGTDSYEGIQKAVDYLAEQGHKKIAFLNGGIHSMVSHERLYSFRTAMTRQGLELQEELVAGGDYTEYCAEKIVPVFLENGATAIVCANDMMAIGVMKELRKLGKDIPKDVSVIGFDDLPLAAYTYPALTTIRQSRKEIGKSAFLVLHELINGSMINKLLLKPKLIIRDSVSELHKE